LALDHHGQSQRLIQQERGDSGQSTGESSIACNCHCHKEGSLRGGELPSMQLSQLAQGLLSNQHIWRFLPAIILDTGAPGMLAQVPGIQDSRITRFLIPCETGLL